MFASDGAVPCEVLAEVAERLALRIRAKICPATGSGRTTSSDPWSRADAGNRPELDRARRDPLELLDQIDDVCEIEALVGDEVAGDGADERGGLRDLTRRQEPVQYRAEELLLPADPREVGNQVARLVAGPHVGQRLVAVERLASSLDVQAGERILSSRSGCTSSPRPACRRSPGSRRGPRRGT